MYQFQNPTYSKNKGIFKPRMKKIYTDKERTMSFSTSLGIQVTDTPPVMDPRSSRG